ncbi:MAG: hypothetical protein KBA61_19595 [Spirochaetes bacterium]|nr:hypothetical protein [Spirochaetota bacterium]
MKCKVTAVLLVLCLIPGIVHGGEDAGAGSPSARTAQDDSEYAPGILPGAASIFPGVLIRGSGHYVAGDKDTAWDLFCIGTASLGVLAGTALYYAHSGASSRLSWPMVPVIAASGSGFALSWLADLYGSTVGMNRSHAGPYRGGGLSVRPFLGMVIVDDVQFEYSRFLHYGLEVHYGAFSVKPMAWNALDDPNNRYLLETMIELVGVNGLVKKFERPLVSASPLVRYGYHDFEDDGFFKRWIDLCAASRITLGSVWNSMRGAWVYYEIGYNREWVTFPVIKGDPVLTTDQLLFEMGFGVDLGRLSAPFGEVYVYYNHRRDDFTGGLTGGFAGYVGVKTEMHVHDGISLKLGYSYGYAAVFDMQCAMRF